MTIRFAPMLLTVAACASPMQPPAPAAPEAAPLTRAPPPVPPRESIRAPFVLRLEGPAVAKPGEIVDVVAVLTRHGRFPGAIALEARPGEGIGLVEGEREEMVEFGEAEEIVRRYRLQIADLRSKFEVSAILSGDGFGATARKRIAFDGSVEEMRDRPRPDGLVQPR